MSTILFAPERNQLSWKEWKIMKRNNDVKSFHIKLDIVGLNLGLIHLAQWHYSKWRGYSCKTSSKPSSPPN
jgi:hypothetical protein